MQDLDLKGETLDLVNVTLITSDHVLQRILHNINQWSILNNNQFLSVKLLFKKTTAILNHRS